MGCKITCSDNVLFVSDDEAAVVIAQEQEAVKGAFGTRTLLELLEKKRLVSSQERAGILAQLREQGRHIL